MAVMSNEQLQHRLAQLLYQCLEELGSTKSALYLAQTETQDLVLFGHFGWPRATPPPARLAPSDPLVLMARRERRAFPCNDGSSHPELEAFAQGRPDPRFFIAPIFDQGEWIGLLLQRDLQGNQPYRLERQGAPTQAICQQIVQAIHQAEAQAEADTAAPDADGRTTPAPAAPAAAAPVVPEQFRFFGEVSRLLFQVVPAAAVALWIHDPLEPCPVFTCSLAPLGLQLQREIITLARDQRPDPNHPPLAMLAKVESPQLAPLEGPFRTLLPILLEEPYGKPDLLMVFRVEDRPFLAQEQEYIRGVARMLALYLDENRLHERYHQSFLSVSHRILASAGAKLPNLRAQSLNTAALARRLARRLELSSPQVEAVTIAAILHDVGTLLLDLRILDKPALTAEDLEQVQAHPALASTFLQGFQFPFDILGIIRHHHERWDGKGYPDGIAEAAIPIESRIIHLVESYQVMTTGTAYRAPRAVPSALAELRLLAGLKYDPHLVEEFIQMLGQDRRPD
jgi:HD-GYP domain-containing protein (c-di-GMP phosphodiesterase class II)